MKFYHKFFLSASIHVYITIQQVKFIKEVTISFNKYEIAISPEQDIFSLQVLINLFDQFRYVLKFYQNSYNLLNMLIYRKKIFKALLHTQHIENQTNILKFQNRAYVVSFKKKSYKSCLENYFSIFDISKIKLGSLIYGKNIKIN